MKKTDLAGAVFCCVLWGVLPIYWNLLAAVDSLLILCCRIVFSLVLMTILLACLGRFRLFGETLRSGRLMKFLVPASLLITLNWGLYIWAVNAGHVLDCSLGYYMQPLAVFLFGVLLFKERCSRLQIAALALAAVGVLVSVVAFGSFPYIALGLAVSFALYGTMKKTAHADPIASICVETLLITPFAVAFALIFKGDGLARLTFGQVLLLIGTGLATGIPMVLYSRSVNNLPFIVVGFLQYISPTIGLVYGLLRGEEMTKARLASFIFILIGLIVFSVDMVKKTRAEKPA
ncbi:MAG: EamA family transporter RarD [Oscillospiraceae bacterium]|nr:EamA family transporter RarD [Oscillospiraceae bacterium]